MDYAFYQTQFQEACADADIAADDDYSGTPLTVIAAPPALADGVTERRLRVQKVTMAIVTPTDASNQITCDGAILAQTTDPATSAVDVVTFDFGPRGIACSAGKPLLFENSAAGTALHLHVEAYIEPVPSE